MKQGDDNEVEVFEVQQHELMLGLVEVIKETQERIGYYEMKSITKDHLNKSSLDEAIKETLKQQKKKLTNNEIQALAGKLYTKIMMKGTIQGLSLLSKYYADAKKMSRQELMCEKHKASRLGRHKKWTGESRPPNVSAHAIVSGEHVNAKAARRILAKWKVRVDDPDNGVFLPRDSRYIPHPELPNAVNHAELHTDEYYVNITNVLTTATSPQECRLALRLIADELRKGTLEY